MDGFSASVGIMNVNNLKATMPAHSTEVIIGDTDVLSGAPYRMTAAGFGDLIGTVYPVYGYLGMAAMLLVTEHAIHARRAAAGD